MSTFGQKYQAPPGECQSLPQRVLNQQSQNEERWWMVTKMGLVDPSGAYAAKLGTSVQILVLSNSQEWKKLRNHLRSLPLGVIYVVNT